jgi:hypothetical protein
MSQPVDMQANLVPRACDPREGTRGSGIIRCRKPGILAKIELRIAFQRPIRFLPETDYPRASRSFPRIAGSGNEIACKLATSLLRTHLVDKLWDIYVCRQCHIRIILKIKMWLYFSGEAVLRNFHLFFHTDIVSWMCFCIYKAINISQFFTLYIWNTYYNN